MSTPGAANTEGATLYGHPGCRVHSRCYTAKTLWVPYALRVHRCICTQGVACTRVHHWIGTRSAARTRGASLYGHSGFCVHSDASLQRLSGCLIHSGFIAAKPHHCHRTRGATCVRVCTRVYHCGTDLTDSKSIPWVRCCGADPPQSAGTLSVPVHLEWSDVSLFPGAGAAHSVGVPSTPFASTPIGDLLSCLG